MGALQARRDEPEGRSANMAVNRVTALIQTIARFRRMPRLSGEERLARQRSVADQVYKRNGALET